MKNLQDTLNESLVNEARNMPYTIVFNGELGLFETTVTLADASQAKGFDKFLSSMIGTCVMAAEGGPNNIDVEED